MAELSSAWAFGAYRKGMGRSESHYRERFAVTAIKRELVTTHGYTQINLGSTRFGSATDQATKAFQKKEGLGVDGLVGKRTSNALFRDRIATLAVPNGWLRALIHWESADDPGAEYTNPDGSLDRGLCMLNSTRKPLSVDEAFDPEEAIGYTGRYLHSRAAELDNCDADAPDKWTLAVGSWRTPVGARDWCQIGAVIPSKDPTSSWAQRAAFYVSRVNTIGRQGWVG